MYIHTYIHVNTAAQGRYHKHKTTYASGPAFLRHNRRSYVSGNSLTAKPQAKRNNASPTSQSQTRATLLCPIDNDYVVPIANLFSSFSFSIVKFSSAIMSFDRIADLLISWYSNHRARLHTTNNEGISHGGTRSALPVSTIPIASGPAGDLT